MTVSDKTQLKPTDSTVATNNPHFRTSLPRYFPLTVAKRQALSAPTLGCSPVLPFVYDLESFVIVFHRSGLEVASEARYSAGRTFHSRWDGSP